MEQHPLPQPITAYEFKLVGSMTLRQFIKLAVGVVIALIFYATKLPGLIRWFFVASFAGMGAAFAFVVLEDIPLEKWVALFFRRTFSPTLYLWGQGQQLAQQIVATVSSVSRESARPAPPIYRPEPRERENPLVRVEIDEDSKEERRSQAKVKTAEVRTETIRKEPVESLPQVQEAVAAQSEVVFESSPLPQYRGPSYQAPKDAIKAEFEKEILPATPTFANVIVGIVLDQEGKMIKDAIVEIQNEKGEPLRALRTNALGQFRTATALSNGKYFILVEKESYRFDTIEISLEGKIVNPVKIKAKEEQHFSKQVIN